jgi:hypothetical protein
MDDQIFDQGREATTVQDLPATNAGTQSLLNELSGMFEDFGPPNPPNPPNPPKPPADTPQPLGEPPEAPAQAVTSEEIPVTSPPRIEPPAAIIWKPSRRARFRFRR